MGSYNHAPLRLPNCPGCGKENGAWIGKSSWGHDVACCSDKCGEAVAGALEQVRQDERYKFFVTMEQHAKAEQTNVRLTYLEMLRSDQDELLAQADAALQP